VVTDLGRAEAFYTGVLGLPVLRRWPDTAGAPRSVWVQLGGGAFLAIEKSTASAPTRADEAPGWHCLALSIAPTDRERWRQRFAAAGVAVFRESPYTIYVRDPDGNVVGLSHYPQEQTVEPRD
jgi:glyoxylase I family protein